MPHLLFIWHLVQLARWFWRRLKGLANRPRGTTPRDEHDTVSCSYYTLGERVFMCKVFLPSVLAASVPSFDIATSLRELGCLCDPRALSVFSDHAPDSRYTEYVCTSCGAMISILCDSPCRPSSNPEVQS